MKTSLDLRSKARSLPALALLCALAGGTGLLLDRGAGAAPEPLARDGVHELSRAFREVARAISPSVVGVQAIHAPGDARVLFHGGDPRSFPFGQEPFRRFFGDDGFLPEPLPMPAPRGQGTGVIIGADGTIATNNHVVAGAQRIQVVLHDGRKLAAELVGTDPETDLAILKVEEQGLPAATLGDSDALEPGDWVVAVGNPFGLDHTVTVGVVSAKDRSNVGVATYEGFIQTDAAINPGNSGGPLVDLEGKVVGINTAIRSSAGGSDGIGFAIPSSTLKSVLPHLIEDGHVSRGWLGVEIQRLTPELARSFGAQADQGTLVARVIPEAPAEEAGLRAGDIVLSVDGKRVDDPIELSKTVAAIAPGTKIELEILRDGEREELTLVLGERPATGERRRRLERPTERVPARWGVRLDELAPELASELEVDHGALVASVLPGSPAEDAGLRAGDVILSVGDERIDSVEECLEALRAADDRAGVRLLVRGQGGTRFVFLQRLENDEDELR
jgi:serine protease Do